MNHDEDDKLWRLMGRARPPQARPAFVQDVLRAVRMSEPEREPGFFEWLQRGWNWLAFTGAAAVVLFLATATQLEQQPEPRPLAAAAQDPTTIDAALRSNDFAAVKDIELLIAFDDSNAWLDLARP